MKHDSNEIEDKKGEEGGQNKETVDDLEKEEFYANKTAAELDKELKGGLESNDVNEEDLDNEVTDPKPPGGQQDVTRQVRLLPQESIARLANTSIVEESVVTGDRTESILYATDDKGLNEVFADDKEEQVDKETLATSSEKYNEITSSGIVKGQQQQHEARAKRSAEFLIANQFGNFVPRGVIRTIRNVDDRSNRAEEGFKATESSTNTVIFGYNSDDSDTGSPFPDLVTMNGDNYRLDSQFCEPGHPQSHLCRQGSSGANSSLTVPVSKYFGDNTVQLMFPQPVFQCTVPVALTSVNKQCHLDEDSIETVTLSPPSSAKVNFTVDIGTHKTVSYRFRYAIPQNASGESTTVTESDNLCHMSKSKLGAVFGEVNIKFYRTCDQ